MTELKITKSEKNSVLLIKNYLNAKNILIMLVLLAFMVLGYFVVEFPKPLFWAFCFAIFINITIKFIQRFKRNVYEIILNQNFIHLKYFVWKHNYDVQWLVSKTQIELVEKKNYKGFYDGIFLQFTNDNRKIKLDDEIWDYTEIEKIYSLFKEFKNEIVPQNEIRIFEQLQLMNNTRKIIK